MYRRSREVPSTQGMVVSESNGNGSSNKTGVCVAIVLGVVLAVLLGVTIALLVRNKNKNNKCHREVIHQKIDAYVKLAKMSLGSMGQGLPDNALDRVGHIIEQENLKSGRAPFFVSGMSSGKARDLLAQAGLAPPSSPASYQQGPMRSGAAPPSSYVQQPKPGETGALAQAFQGGMTVPPCGAVASLDKPLFDAARGPLTAEQISPLDYKMATGALNAGIRSQMGDPALNVGGGLIPTMHQAAQEATGPLYAGKTGGEMFADKQTAALNAVGAPQSTGVAPLAPYQGMPKQTGLLADGSSYIQPTNFVHAGSSNQPKGTDIGVAMTDNSDEIYKAFDKEDAAQLQAAFNLSNQMPATSLLGEDYRLKQKENTLRLHQLAVENPESAGQILLSSTALQQPTMGQMRQQFLNMGSVMRPAMIRPNFKLLNIQGQDYLRAPKAAPMATGYTESSMNQQQAYVQNWRANICS